MAERERLASLFRLQLRLMAGLSPASPSSRDRRRGSRKRMLINTFIYLFFASSLLTMSVTCVQRLIAKVTSLSLFVSFSYVACMITSTLVMVARRDRMNHVTSLWIKQLEDPGCHLLFVRLLMLTAWVPLLMWRANHLATSAAGLSRLPPLALAHQIASLLIVIQDSWLSLTYSYYCMAVLIHASLEQQRLTAIARSCAHSSCSCAATLASLQRIRRSRILFERLFSLFPVLWFSFGITCLPGYVSFFGHQGLLLWTVMAAVNFLPSMLVVLVVARQDERSARLVSVAADVVTDNPWLTWGSKTLLLRSLDAVRETRRSGMRFSPLDKSFLVSYSGALLSFGVLLYSLLSGRR